MDNLINVSNTVKLWFISCVIFHSITEVEDSRIKISKQLHTKVSSFVLNILVFPEILIGVF